LERMIGALFVHESGRDFVDIRKHQLEQAWKRTISPFSTGTDGSAGVAGGSYRLLP
jgi:hypothetical protein